MAHLRAETAREQSVKLLAVAVSCLRVNRKQGLCCAAAVSESFVRCVLQFDECFLLQCEKDGGGSESLHISLPFAAAAAKHGCLHICTQEGTCTRCSADALVETCIYIKLHSL